MADAGIDCPDLTPTLGGCYSVLDLIDLPLDCPLPRASDGGSPCFGTSMVEWRDPGYVPSSRRPIMPKPEVGPPAPEPIEPAAPAVVPSVGVDTAISQAKSILPSDASPGLIIAAVAVFAVLAALFRFGPRVLKSREEAAEKAHEIELKKLELEEKRQQRQDDSHGECKTARAALETRVGQVESGLTELKSDLRKVADRINTLDFPDMDEDDDRPKRKARGRTGSRRRDTDTKE